jgi:hypothetical protein
MSKAIAAKLDAAMRHANQSKSAIEDWVATSLFAKFTGTNPTAQSEDGKFVMLHSGAIDLIAPARAAVESARTAQAAEQRRREHPGSHSGHRLPSWSDT